MRGAWSDAYGQLVFTDPNGAPLNGGYLTNCLITLKDPPVKIKAASSGAGILDTVAEWGFNDEPAYPIVFKKGLPWEQPERFTAQLRAAFRSLR